jgi:flagellar motor switch protein FliM
MEKILNQDEIDALFRATQKGQIPSAANRAAQKNVTSFNLREISRINKEQVRALSTLHENFARNITNSLGAYLRVAFDFNLVSVEQLTFSEIVSRLPDLTYLCSMRMQPMDAVGLLQMDLAVAFPIMDLVLGGPGRGAFELRDLTEIEEQILESVMHILTRELQSAWAPVLQVNIEFEQRQQSSHTQMLMGPTERCLALSFEIKMPDAHGMLNVTLPAVASNAVLRKLTAQTAFSSRGSSAAHVQQIQRHLLDAGFVVDLRLPTIPVSIRDLTDLQAGQVLLLRRPVEQPAILYVAEMEMFDVYPVACGLVRGAQILHRNSIIPTSGKEGA